jgi:hypothetical protein
MDRREEEEVLDVVEAFADAQPDSALPMHVRSFFAVDDQLVDLMQFGFDAEGVDR